MTLDSMMLLEVLCLALYSNDIETENIIKVVLDMQTEALKKGDTISDQASNLYIQLLTEIKNGEFDCTCDSDVETLLLKVSQHKEGKENPEIMQRLDKIASTRKQISPNRITSLRNKIKKAIMVVKGSDNLKKMFRASNTILSSLDTQKQDTIFLDLLNHSKALTRIYEDRLDGVRDSVDFINMSDPESIKKGLAAYKYKREHSGYKVGLQGVARMYGKAGGPVPGEFVAIGGCSYNYKTGELMDMTRWMAQYNAPRKKTNKPAAIIFISLENQIHENMIMWFKSAYMNMFHKKPEGMTDDEITASIANIYSKNGFELLVFRRDESFGFEEWKALHEEYSEKYEIIMSVCDYLGMMDISSMDGDIAPKQLQNLVCRMKNYGNRMDMITATGLQLNGGAEEIAKSGVNNIVKKFGAVHLADAKAIKRECDVLIFLHIETNHLGDAYLTMRLDKHKYITTPECDKYTAYKFEEDIGIPDDIYGMDLSVSDIYSINNTPHLAPQQVVAAGVKVDNKSVF